MNTNNFIKRLNNNNCSLLNKENKFKKNYTSYIDLLKELQKGKKLHLCGWSRSCGYNNLQNIKHNNIASLLSFARINFVVGNDAPRGGQSGQYIELTAKGKQQFADIDFELLR